MAAEKKQQNVSMGDIDNLQKFADIKYTDENYSETIGEVPSLIQRGTIYLITIAIIVTGAILFFGKSNKVVTAHGKIVTVGGDYKIHSSCTGEVNQVLAKEGDHLKKGAPIAILNVEGENPQIVMPVDGQILKMNTLHGGQFIKKSEEIATVHPDSSDLIVEAFIRNKEISSVKEGQQVQIKVDAYPFQQFGTLQGEVESILPAVSAEGQLKVSIKLLTDHFKAANKKMRIFAGLTVAAEIETGEQRLISMVFNSNSGAAGE